MVAFSKPVRATDVGIRFSLPCGMLRLLPFESQSQRRVSFTAVDATGRDWPFTCSVRSGRYLKPVLTGSSWLPFVRAKGLVIGDMVVFDHDPVAGFRIRVRKLIRTIRLMGRCIACHADEE